ncbi:hypothetical protein [Brachybacterium sp. GPGPB12]|uniref:hypothetical protein n=1 Tax=Brachybacterium sp. GPGPB12 TaxID=3023517 RepID=UPI0031343643
MIRSRSARSGTPLGWEHLPAPDLRGRTVVMTGASDGLGREAALQLALWGADLVLAVRAGPRARSSAPASRRRRGDPGRCAWSTWTSTISPPSARSPRPSAARPPGPGSTC